MNPNDSTASTVATLTEHHPVLRRGAKGPEVVLLQNELAAAGCSPGGSDGDFGKNTEGAVRKFQSLQGLTVDGVVGPNTWAALARPRSGHVDVGSAVVAAAKTQLNVPYSWGGGGIHGPTKGTEQGAHTVGFDCSSLMQYSYYVGAHISIPRNTHEQYKGGKHMDFTQRAPGDLIFYNKEEHVALYAGRVNGTEMIVEAPHTGGHVQFVKMSRPGTPESIVVRFHA